MSSGDWIVTALIFTGCTVGLWFAVRRRSPSRRGAAYGQQMIAAAAVKGMEQGAQQRAAFGVIGMTNGAPTATAQGCPVCGLAYSEVGPSHRYTIEDDLRTCWTP